MNPSSPAIILSLLFAGNALCQVTAPLKQPTNRVNAAASAVVAPTNQIQPTVTAAMGDRGGKFFGQTPDPAKVRRYYIAAEPQLWDYTPQDRDVVCGKPLPPHIVQNKRHGKLRYVQYTDETFTTKAFENERLGIMGPVLRGVTGEFLLVTFLNRTSIPLSMHPHGARYDKDSEGAFYEPRPGLGSAVGPNAKFTYVWHLDEASGPASDEPSSKAWLYHSHVEADDEANMGLVGFIVVTDPARARADGTPKDIDREMAALFMMFDESGLGAAEKEAAEYGTLGLGMVQRTWSEMQEILELGARASINGYIFGNLPGLEMTEGEKVRWYLFSLGSIDDFHTAHWHGMRVVEEGRRRTDVVELLPASMKVADMVADNPGVWLFHCHVAEHMQEGMFAAVTVHPKDKPTRAEAFFGMQEAVKSLRVQRVRVGKKADEAALQINGVVTVYQAFSVFTDPITVRLGNKEATFKLDRKGNASNEHGTFRAINSSNFGVVYGGLMEFEVNLKSKDWITEASKPEAAFSLKFRSASHSTKFELPK